MSVAVQRQCRSEARPTAARASEEGWLARYRAMAELLYEVRRRYPRLATFGISVLHPRYSLAPNQLRLLDQWSDAKASVPQMPSRRALLIRWLRCVLYACGEIMGLVWVKGRVWRALRQVSQEPATVLINTWWFGPDSRHQHEDFYFGSLVQQLEARGIKTVLLCGDTRENVDVTFATAVLGRRDVRAVPDALLVPLWAPLVLVAHQVRSAFALRRWAAHEPDARLAQVCAMAAVESVQPITMRNALRFYSAKAAVKRWHARVFVTLYEGQPWEQPAWQGAKAQDLTCVLVGYQHTILMQHSLDLVSPRRIVGEIAAPDVVLCVGEVTRTMMARGHQPFGTRLVTFGTFRRAPALTSAAQRAPEPDRRTVVVLPEGILQEARLLFDFAMRLASVATDHRFIFRSHPVLPFEQVRPQLHDDPSRRPNIELSGSDPISADFDRASVVLYRGSSSVLYALSRGLKPLFVHDDGSPDLDPLFALNGWREWVASPGEAAQALWRYAEADPVAAAELWRPVAEYASAYTRPVTDESIDRFVEAVGLPR